MSQQLQLIYDEITAKKTEQKKSLEDYKYALKNNQKYQTILDEIRELVQRRKGVEELVAGEVGLDEEKIDEIKKDLKDKNEMLSDLTINDLIEGKIAEVEKDGIKYAPVFSVKFKKI